jgi:DNA-directed RNA polymerase I, II, and III subunit RPABC2
MENFFSITKYEKVRLLGLRATQLANGAMPLTNIGNLNNPLKIAEKEFIEGVIPISIIKPLPNGTKVKVKIQIKDTN